MGSLAFGALILTLVQIVRILLEYIDHKTRGKADVTSSHCLRYLEGYSTFSYLLGLFLRFSVNRTSEVLILTKNTLFSATFNIWIWIWIPGHIWEAFEATCCQCPKKTLYLKIWWFGVRVMCLHKKESVSRLMASNKSQAAYTCFGFLSPAAQNPVARFILCCMKCCFWCLEKFIKFLNRNAYIMVSTTHYSTVWARFLM